MSQVADALAPPARTIFGQPRGLATLFLTEMWERFTYYGIRAMLILFMVAAVSRGGLGIDDRTSSSIYGLYLGSTYLLGLFGGWIADRLIGAQRAVITGGVLITAGNALLAVGNQGIFFLGLLVNAMGVGLLKPNVSAIVASALPGRWLAARCGLFDLLHGHQSRRGPRLGHRSRVRRTTSAGASGSRCPRCSWRSAWCSSCGRVPTSAAAGLQRRDERRGSWTPVDHIPRGGRRDRDPRPHPQRDARRCRARRRRHLGLRGCSRFCTSCTCCSSPDSTRVERKRALVMVALFIGSVTFWVGYFQQGASFNLFAERYTDRHILGWEMPAGVLQAVNPFFVITLAGVFAALWIALGKRGRDPLASAKFGVALILLGVGFLVMYFAAQHVLAGQLVLPTWLVLTYFLHTCGELCISPVGLSYMSKLAPPRFVGQAMGVWFLSLALGGNLAGQLTGQYDASNLASLPALFLRIFWYGVIAGVLMLLLTPLVRRLMAGVR